MYNNLYYYNKYKFRVVAIEGREAERAWPSYFNFWTKKGPKISVLKSGILLFTDVKNYTDQAFRSFNCVCYNF